MGLLEGGELGARFGEGEGWFGHGCVMDGWMGLNPNPDAGIVSRRVEMGNYEGIYIQKQ